MRGEKRERERETLVSEGDVIVRIQEYEVLPVILRSGEFLVEGEKSIVIVSVC